MWQMTPAKGEYSAQFAYDSVGRCGGEEFVVILAPTEAEFAASVLERFRKIVEGADFPQVGRVTVSIGYTAVTPRDNGLTAFGRADEALYVAKRQGRNQVQCHEHLISGGVLRLGANMKPGDYVLQVVVTDKLAKTTATQWSDFEVRDPAALQ